MYIYSLISKKIIYKMYKNILATRVKRNCVTMENSEKECLRMEPIDSQNPHKYD